MITVVDSGGANLSSVLFALERLGVPTRLSRDPDVILSAYAVTRRGRNDWPPLRAVLDLMRPPPGKTLHRPQWPRPEAAPPQ